MGLFKPKSSAQTVTEVEDLPPAPERTDAQTEALAEEQRKRFATSASGGRASTYLSGGGATEATSAVRYLGTSSQT